MIDWKKRRSTSPDILQFNEELVLNFQHQGGLDRVAEAIRDMADQGGLTLEDLENHEAATPSFSNATWKEVAPTFSFPIASLPPSFHRKVMRESVKFLDVHQERGAQKEEAARVRLLTRYAPHCPWLDD